jgi:hypothetical protein
MILPYSINIINQSDSYYEKSFVTLEKKHHFLMSSCSRYAFLLILYLPSRPRISYLTLTLLSLLCSKNGCHVDRLNRDGWMALHPRSAHPGEYAHLREPAIGDHTAILPSISYAQRIRRRLQHNSANRFFAQTPTQPSTILPHQSNRPMKGWRNKRDRRGKEGKDHRRMQLNPATASTIPSPKLLLPWLLLC